jgi:hypothetical protein
MNKDRLIKVQSHLASILACHNLRVQSANYVRTELPVRIAHRLRDLQVLPYVVVTQEGLSKVYEVRLCFVIFNIVLFA